MAIRKAGQPVLDYDPLAWLKDEEPELEAVSRKPAKKKKVKKKLVSKKPSNKKITAAKAVEMKLTERKPSTISAKISEAIVISTKTDDLVENKKSDSSETDQLNLVKQANGKLGMSDEAAFGLFTELPEVADDSFGFFDDLAPVSESTNSAATSGNTCSSVVQSTIESAGAGNEGSISIGPELTIKNVADVKALIDQKLLQSEEIIIDTNDLHKIDTAGLQLLFAVNSTLAKTGQNIGWRGSDKVVGLAASYLGLSWPPQTGSLDSGTSVGDTNYGFF
ncbi:MAG: anti-anti-sigma regulatory factor [Gammaproteobacteria bacterium]